MVDGDFSDWDSVEPVWVDTIGDGGAIIDFRHVWMADDDKYLYIRFDLTNNVDISESNGLRLYLDLDLNPATGLPVGGLGAEFEWRFGQRAGSLYAANGGTLPVSQWNVGFRGAPTLTLPEYEIAIEHSCHPDGINPLIPNPTMRVLLIDLNGPDRIPNAGQQLIYTMGQGDPLPPESQIPLARESACDIRVGQWNVLNDGIFDPGLQSGFRRELQAAQPDILFLEEIYDHTPLETLSLVESWLTPAAGRAWHAAGNQDCKIISQFPILSTWPLDGNLAALLDTSAVLGHPLLAICAHLPCCTNENGRQLEVDRIMAFVRDARQPGGSFDLEPSSPILIGGDLNLVGLAQQLRTLLQGDIVNASFGPDFSPDWDGSPLTSVLPRLSDARMGYTWRNDNDPYWPGHLDYLIYSDYVLSVGRSFVLYTPEMSAESLAQKGLLADDSLVSDHCLFVADFHTNGVGSVSGDVDHDGDVDLSDLSLLLAHFGAGPQPPAEAGDTDGDGDVDLADLATLLANFGASC